MALVGPSGAGKTLTARLACLPPPEDLLLEGSVTVAGRSGLLAQESATALDPRSTVGRQLGLVARARARDRAAARAAVRAVLAELGLAPDVADRHPTVLSGGQRQRAALALALLADPDLLVVDEPTSALDPVTAAEVVGTVRRALDRRRAALLLVTHDPGVAAALCDRVVRIEGAGCSRGAHRWCRGRPLPGTRPSAAGPARPCSPGRESRAPGDRGRDATAGRRWGSGT
ncbi:ATP-binding cassette domain-containing protein [Nocardioides zeae]